MAEERRPVTLRRLWLNPSGFPYLSLTLFCHGLMMVRITATFLAALLLAPALVFVPAQPVAAQGQCSFCDTNPPPIGEGGGRPNNGPGGNGNGNNGNGGGNGGSNQIELSIESDIDFGRLVMIGDGIGRVLVDLQTGAKTVVGNLDDLGGMAVQGRAIIRGTPSRTIRVDFPNSIIMRDPSGAEAEVRDFVSDLSALPLLDAAGILEFNFTGTLYTDAAIAIGGNLRGRVPIQVSYD